MINEVINYCSSINYCSISYISFHKLGRVYREVLAQCLYFLLRFVYDTSVSTNGAGERANHRVFYALYLLVFLYHKSFIVSVGIK